MTAPRDPGDAALRRLVRVIGLHGHVAPEQLKSIAHRNNWDVEVAIGLDDVVEACKVTWPNVVVVDCGGLSAAEIDPVFSWLRRQARIAAVAVTDPEQVDARLLALRHGIDDHAVAPVDERELEARLRAQLDRSARHTMRIVGDFTLDRAGRRVVRRGRSLPLTPAEMAVIERLLLSAGQVVTKVQLAQAIDGTARSENAVEVHVSSLRRKLAQAGPALIHTVHRGGYVLRPLPAFDLAQRAELLETRERVMREREQALAERDRILADVDRRLRRQGPRRD